MIVNGLAWDDKIGWYDPEVAYCINGDGNLAVSSVPYAMYGDNMITEAVCLDCLNN